MSAADREIVYRMKVEGPDSADAEKRLNDLSAKIERTLRESARKGLDQGFLKGYQGGARTIKTAVVEAMKDSPQAAAAASAAGEKNGQAYASGFSRGASSGARRGNGGKVVGFAGAAVNGWTDIDKKQIEKAQKDIERFRRQAEQLQEREDARAAQRADAKAAADRRRAEQEQARRNRDLKKIVADEEKYHAGLRKAKEQDEQRRMTAGNRQLAGLVRSGPQAVEQDRRRAEQARRQAEREQRASEREAEIAARHQLEAQTRVREGIYGTVHAFGQLTRAAAQFGLVGQRDMARVLDTIFAVEGSINALQGAMGAARAIRGIRGAAGAAGGVRNLGPAAALAAGPLARLGARGVIGGGFSTIGSAIALPAGYVAALGAGAIGLAGAVADSRRGVGPGHVGGFWDTVGKIVNSPVSSIQGGFLNLGSAIERSLNEPYGLTTKESDYRSQRLQEEQFQRDFGGELGKDESPYAAMRRAKLWERRTELLEKYTHQEIGRRGAIREQKEAEGSIRAPLEARLRASEYGLEAQRFGIRSSGLQARGGIQERLRGEAFERRQTARGEELELRQTRALGGYVSAVQEARAREEREIEEGRASGFREARRSNIAIQFRHAQDRGRTLGAQYLAAREKYEAIRPNATSAEGMTNAGSQTELATAYREMQEASERLKKNEEEVLRLKQEQRQVGVEGAREELQSREQSLGAAKQLANALRNERQTDKESFGRLLPEQQASAREALNALNAGTANRLQVQLAERFGFAREKVREYYEGKASEGGFENLYGQSGRGQELVGAEAEEKKARTITDSARDTLAEKLQEEANQRAKENADVILPLLEKALKFERDETNRLIQEGLSSIMREINQQGRIGAGA